jgi:hypothetical protein
VKTWFQAFASDCNLYHYVKASKEAEKEQARAAKEAERAAKDSAKEADKAAKETAKEADKAAKDADRVAKEEEKEAARLAKEEEKAAAAAEREKAKELALEAGGPVHADSPRSTAERRLGTQVVSQPLHPSSEKPVPKCAFQIHNVHRYVEEKEQAKLAREKEKEEAKEAKEAERLRLEEERKAEEAKKLKAKSKQTNAFKTFFAAAPKKSAEPEAALTKPAAPAALVGPLYSCVQVV